MDGNGFTMCLWFDTESEDAARFYLGIFKDGSLGRVSRYSEAGPRPAGTVMTVEFELNGQQFLALNGGPEHHFNEAISLVVPCADQDEVDYYWDRLGDGGEEIACGWVRDRYGLCWQVVPTVFPEMITDADPERVRRVTAAMLTMKKLDIAALQRAYDGA